MTLLELQLRCYSDHKCLIFQMMMMMIMMMMMMIELMPNFQVTCSPHDDENNWWVIEMPGHVDNVDEVVITHGSIVQLRHAGTKKLLNRYHALPLSCAALRLASHVHHHHRHHRLSSHVHHHHRHHRRRRHHRNQDDLPASCEVSCSGS